jgi:hypothetical protein
MGQLRTPGSQCRTIYKVIPPLRYIYVELLLVKTFVKTLFWQLYLKMTKFSRRSKGPIPFLKKICAGYSFISDMFVYNIETIHRCRRCVKNLTAEKVPAVFIYGEKPIIEVFRDLSFRNRIVMTILQERGEITRLWGCESAPVETSASRDEKIIIASIVNAEERAKRLQQLDVSSNRIVLLIR